MRVKVTKASACVGAAAAADNDADSGDEGNYNWSLLRNCRNINGRRERHQTWNRGRTAAAAAAAAAAASKGTNTDFLDAPLPSCRPTTAVTSSQ